VNGSLWPIFKQSSHWWVVEWIRSPLNHPSYITILSRCLYLSFVYQSFSLFHKLLQHFCKWDFADTAQLNTWKGSYAYNIVLSTLSLLQHPDTIEYHENSCVLRADIAHMEIHISPWLIANSSMNPCSSAVTHKVPTKYIVFCRLSMLHQFLCYAVTANAQTVMHHDYV